MTAPATCSPTATSAAQHTFTINKDTVLGTSILKSVKVNDAIMSTSGTVLSSMLYTQNVIEFMSLASNVVEFNLDGFSMVHKRLIVRARAYTECSATMVENQTVVMTVTGTTPSTVTKTLIGLT
jgi:hypothetical protein